MTTLDWIMTATWVVLGAAGTVVLVREARRHRRDQLKPDYARIRQLEEELGIRPKAFTLQSGREYYRLRNGRVIEVGDYDAYVAVWGDEPDAPTSLPNPAQEARYLQSMREKWGDETADLDAIRDYPAGGRR